MKPPAAGTVVLVLCLGAGTAAPPAAASQETGTGSPPATPREGASDRITLPAAHREFRSPAGEYLFVVETTDGWHSLRGRGQLRRLSGAAPTLLWQRELPQQFGPRYVLVTDSGQVLMFDEWINVPTAMAVQLVGADGRVVAQYGTPEIAQWLGMPMTALIPGAASGWWISSPPTLQGEGAALSAVVATGGRLLRIHLPDGRLSVD